MKFTFLWLYLHVRKNGLGGVNIHGRLPERSTLPMPRRSFHLEKKVRGGRPPVSFFAYFDFGFKKRK